MKRIGRHLGVVYAEKFWFRLFWRAECECGWRLRRSLNEDSAARSWAAHRVSALALEERARDRRRGWPGTATVLS